MLLKIKYEEVKSGLDGGGEAVLEITHYKTKKVLRGGGKGWHLGIVLGLLITPYLLLQEPFVVGVKDAGVRESLV